MSKTGQNEISDHEILLIKRLKAETGLRH